MKLLVLYASETGTAQDVSEEIWRSAKRKGLSSTVSSLDDYNLTELLLGKLIIFVVATTGQGDPPYNMRYFWKFLLRKNLQTNLFHNLKYAVLGLGDSSYKKFNFVARRLNKRIAQLGGTQLLPTGLADNQHNLGIDAVVGPWIDALWKIISNVLNISLTEKSELTNTIIERYQVLIKNKNKLDLETSIHPSLRLHNYAKIYTDIYAHDVLLHNKGCKATIIENKRITADNHFQDVRLIKLQAKDIHYEPGDILYIRPKNSIEQIKCFFNILHKHNVQLYPNMSISISKKEILPPCVLTQNLTLQEIVEQYWDLNFKPRRSTMHNLSLISTNKLEKDKLCEFSSIAGQEELYDYINRPRRNILEVFVDFPHTTSKLSITSLFEIMVPIRARPYSIASSLCVTPDIIEILVAVVKFKTKLIEPRFGLCSNWLANLKVNDKVISWVESGTFRFRNERPTILVGPGTGVAPFRSFLLNKAANEQDMKNDILFFGCRKKDKDFHFQEDFKRLCNENNLKIFCAFSRDQDHKIYVQDIIRQQGELCWQYLQNDGMVCVAGNSKNMPKDVRTEFVNMAIEIGKMTEDEAETYIQYLEKKCLYQTETWG